MTIATVRRLELEELPLGTRTHLRVEAVADGLGREILWPVIVARGARPGPVLGLTAVLHGNELNGIPVIHRLLQRLDLQDLRGTVVAVPVVNVPGYHRSSRLFTDMADLNRAFPGKEGGTQSQVFVARFLDRIASAFQFHIDLHTASFGRVNSLYVRADLQHEIARSMALKFEPQILLHNSGADGTLRDAAMDLGIPSVTIEVGNPQRIQDDLVQWSISGVQQVMAELGMLTRSQSFEPPWETVVCGRSYWLHTDRGGILEVVPELVDHMTTGQRLAQVTDVFGNVVREYFAPEAGVVIGRSTNPVNQTGSRIVHLGIIGDPETAPTASDE